MSQQIRRGGWATVLAVAITATCMVGCEQKEKVIDIETGNGGGVEVYEDPESGDVDIEIDSREP